MLGCAEFPFSHGTSCLLITAVQQHFKADEKGPGARKNVEDRIFVMEDFFCQSHNFLSLH